MSGVHRWRLDAPARHPPWPTSSGLAASPYRLLLARVTSTVPGLSPRAGPTCRCAGSVQGNQCCPGLSLPSTGRRPCPLRARPNGEPGSSAVTHGQSQYPLTCIAAAQLSRRRSLPSWSCGFDSRRPLSHFLAGQRPFSVFDCMPCTAFSGSARLPGYSGDEADLGWVCARV